MKNTNENEGAVAQVNLQCADIVDWSQHCFPLGVKLAGMKNAPWLELDEDDLKLLHKILTISLMIPAEGGGVRGLPPLASNSESLFKLAGWAKAAATWLAGRKKA